MNLVFGALIYAVVAAIVGWLIVGLAGWSRARLSVAACPAVGVCALAMQLWLYGLVGLPWNPVTLLLPWVVVAALLRHSLRAGLSAAIAAARQEGRALLWLAPAAILLLPELAALALRPVVGNDSIAVWMMRARVFLAAGKVDIGRVADVARHPDYPPLYSLFTDSTWVLTGQATDQLGKAVDAVLMVALLACVVRAFWRPLGPVLTSVAALALVTMPSLEPFLYSGYYMGYADFAIACLLAISALSLYSWLTAGAPSDLALGMALALAAAVTKNEGVFFVIAFVAVAVVAGGIRGLLRLDRRTLVALALAAIPAAGWRAFLSINHYSSEFLGGGAVTGLARDSAGDRVVHVALFALHTLDILRTDYAWIVIAGLTALGLALVSRDRAVVAVSLLLVLQGLGYFLVYVTLPGNIDYWLNTSFDRLAVQLLPLSVVALLAGLDATGPGRQGPPEQTARSVPRAHATTMRPGLSEP